MAKKIKVTGKSKPKIKVTGKAKPKISPKEFAKALGAEIVAPLTVAQIEALAERLHGTCQNVYTVTKQMFNIEIGEEVFDLLESVGEVFKCEQCNTWHNISVKDPDVEGFCTECVNEMNNP